MKLVYVIGAFLAMIFLSACQKELTWCLDCPSKAYLIKDSATGECDPIEIAGLYKKNIRTKPGINYVTIFANVEESGLYNVKTDSINGVIFRTEGAFTGIGRQEMKFFPFGTPIDGGSFEYTVKLDTTECTFTIDFIEDSSTSTFISCLIGNDTERTDFNFQATGGFAPVNAFFSFSGFKTSNPNGSRFKAQVQLNSGSVLTNQDYTVNRANCDVQAEYRDDAGVVYKALTSQGPQASNPFTIRLTRLTSERRFGTFKGKMFKEGGSPVDTILIKDGRFDFPY
jgi:hypothetical protein